MRKLAVAVACNFAFFSSANLSLCGQDVQYHPQIFNEVNHAVSPPLKAVRPDTFLQNNGHNIVPSRPITPNQIRNAPADGALQTSTGPLVSNTGGQNFDGVPANDYALLDQGMTKEAQ